MKILFIDTYYPKFLRSFRKNNSDISKLSYVKHRDRLLSTYFGTSDFFSFNLKPLGWQAEDLIVNDEELQRKWAKENGAVVKEGRLISRFKSLPYVNKLFGRPQWIQQIVVAQVKRYKPDIVYCQNLSVLDPATLTKIKGLCRLLVGQIACPKPPNEYLKKYDLIVSSFPHYVKEFKQMGLESEYQKLAFESRILNKIGKQKRIYDVTFIGSFTPDHSEGTKVLEEVAKKIPVHVWGQGLEYLSPNSSLRKNYHGEAWGLGMYKILAQSKIVINRHISVSSNYANNMRLYEATGIGAMLITDKKINLKDLFNIGTEIEEYKDSKDLSDKIKYFLENDIERIKIAKAGQLRTLKDHNYPVRMKELNQLILKYL